MGIGEFWRVILRHWVLTLIGVLVTIAAGATVVVAGGPKYELNASVVLLPPANIIPKSEETGDAGNPFLYMSGLEPARSVLQSRMSSEAVVTRLEAQGAKWVLEPDPISAAPALRVIVEADTPELATETLDAVLGQIPIALDSAQEDAGVVRASRITSLDVVREATPNTVWKGMIRQLIVVVFACIAITVFVIAVREGLSRQRDRQVGETRRQPTSKKRGPSRPNRRVRRTQRSAQSASRAGVRPSGADRPGETVRQ